jgi:hypothetical protein
MPGFPWSTSLSCHMPVELHGILGCVSWAVSSLGMPGEGSSPSLQS